MLYDPMHVVASYFMADLLTMPVTYAPAYISGQSHQRVFIRVYVVMFVCLSYYFTFYHVYAPMHVVVSYVMADLRT